MVLNRDLFQHDPATSKLLNEGVAAVKDWTTPQELETLRYELSHFVCEGQYKDGVIRILESYIGNVSSTSQPAAWVSGFFGSGKTHLEKMLRHLWVNTQFIATGETARGLAHLPTEVKEHLKELDTLGVRFGGLHAAAGALPAGGGLNVRLAVLGILFQSKGLPESLPQAQFCLWLKKSGLFNKVKKNIEATGKDFLRELNDLYVSPVIARALLEADSSFAGDEKKAREAIRAQFPRRESLSDSEFIILFKESLEENGKLPCTLIVLDEMQLYIGGSAERSLDVQMVAEALCKQMNCRVMLVGAGQTALAGSDPLLQRLRDRFKISVELSDSDVETVTRRVVLAKKADKRKLIEEALDANAGEVDRHLASSKIGPRSEDRRYRVDDYPLLSVRRRFWEHVLRSIDLQGTTAQLRTQLRIVHDAVRSTADKPVGTVLPADSIFEQLQPILLQSGVLPREMDETIRNMRDGSDDGGLASRLCGLIFLIRKLSREKVADIGVRANAEALADLMVEDLENDGARLRKKIPELLSKLEADSILIKLDDEYSLQTRESGEWENEFRRRAVSLTSNQGEINSKRSSLLNAECQKQLIGSIRLVHGQSKTTRSLYVHYGSEEPATDGTDVPVWIRDGWSDSENSVLIDARRVGMDSPVIFVFIAKSSAEDIHKVIVEFEAAKQTLETKGVPATAEGNEARNAMLTRKATTESNRDRLIRELVESAKVFKGGGGEVVHMDLVEKVKAAASDSLDRMFPNFKEADDSRWHTVINQAKEKNGNALAAVGFMGNPDKHPVCAALMAFIGSGKKGREIRDQYEAAPYGWPRDAIDGALITLHTAGHVRAMHKGTVLVAGQLDQAKVPVTDFRTETVAIDTKGKIKLRKLFQETGLTCRPDEETMVAEKFLEAMYSLAGKSGGEPPLPQVPKTVILDAIRTLAGNEMLTAILKEHDELKRMQEEWQARAKLAEKRLPAWATLIRLSGYAYRLPEMVEIQKEIDAIRNERRLLEDSDPIRPIHEKLVKLLRGELKRAHDVVEQTFDYEMKALEDNPSWQKISQTDRERLLGEVAIEQVGELSIGDDSLLLSALAERSLEAWAALSDALPERFRQVSLSAAKLLEPKTQSVKLKSSTLKTTDDVNKWLVETEKDLLDKIKKGPIIIG
jgi:hypothetical protein